MSILGQLFALATAGCWAHNSVVYGRAGIRVGSGAVTHVRLWIALPLMAAVHLIALGRIIPVDLGRAGIALLLMSGFLGFFVADVFLFRAFVEIGHRETLVILTLSPIFAATISWLTIGETLRPVEILGIVTTVVGVSWVVFVERGGKERRRSVLRGYSIALLGALAQAVGMVLAKRGMGESIHPLSANLLRISAGLAGIAIFRFAGRRGLADFRAMRDRTALALIAQGAVVGPVFGIIMNLYALSLAPVGVVTAIAQISPIILLPYDRLVLRRRLRLGAYLGTTLAVAGAALLFL